MELGRTQEVIRLGGGKEVIFSTVSVKCGEHNARALPNDHVDFCSMQYGMHTYI